MTLNHKPVLLKEVIEFLDLKNQDVVADLTLGMGGHSKEFLKVEGINLIAFDSDKESIDQFRNYLKNEYKVKEEKINERTLKISFSGRTVFLVNDNFSEIKEYLKILEIQNVDKLLADLGWSSTQLSTVKGLSYQNPTDELDMRLDTNLGVKAKDLLNGLGKKELKKMFSEYADINKEVDRLVANILSARDKKPFENVSDLLNAVNKSINLTQENKNSFYSRAFQALRIAVNNEFFNLRKLFQKFETILKKESRAAIITFHSGEERIVKDFVKSNSENLKLISEQFGYSYIRPSVDELMDNIRSRSAKLFVIKKTI